ncbi:MAG: adenine deaminase [Spirochaetes bacterium]|nr:adenine deaminase [Spirochaetota bacterium]
MNRETLEKLIDAAAGRVPADLVIKGGIVADVYSGQFVEKDLAVCGGRIAALAEPGTCDGLEVFDAGGQYVLPGFIDSHIHIESSFLTPGELGRLLLPLGTCTIIADPHEIVNVCGIAGLKYMLVAARDTAMDVKFMLPSCVPAAPFENAGAVLDSWALSEPIKSKYILGLGELMNYPGVVYKDKEVMEKILLAKAAGKQIDGHSPGLTGRLLNAYAATSIHTDHECSTPEELTERVALGMYVLLRQGSACHDLRNLLPAVTAENSRRCVICSDDYQPTTVFEQGHLNNDLRICVEEGLSPMTALRMATLNAAECFRLADRGGLAPGLRADIVIAKDVKDFKVSRVYVRGVLCAENGVVVANRLQAAGKSDDRQLRSSFHVKDFSEARLKLKLKSDTVWVIDLTSGRIVTGKGKATVTRDESGAFVRDDSVDIAKIAVVERHLGTGNVGVALLRGYGIQAGAVALSVAHDSHNIIVVGVNDADMVCGVNRLVEIGGGAVLVKDGQVIEEMPLPLGGIMSDQSGEWVDAKLKAIDHKAVAELGVNKKLEPLMSLCFMSLSVIPELKLTDMGLFDVGTFNFIPLEAE